VTVEEILDALRANAVPLDDVRAPSAPGVYAWFLDDARVLPSLPAQGPDPIYVGLSSDLAVRECTTHFKAGQSGFSTLRRSLGALLKDELHIRAQPRGTGASSTNYRNYRFDDAGEAVLSGWMREHRRVAVHPCADPDGIETDLIALACPPLNLTKWANPHAAEIKALRKACVEEAKRDHAR
jgi:hypothetical protein